jgi:ABC-type dipeptide/oligopeptide/nickel transport system permease subunit
MWSKKIIDWTKGSRFWALSNSSKLSFSLGVIIISAIFLLALFAEYFAPFDPFEFHVEALLQHPGGEYILGTDNLGRDILSRSIYGVRISLFIGFGATIFASSVGSTLGVLSGYLRGSLDRMLTLIMDALWALPGFVQALLISVILGPSIQNTAIAIGIGWIPSYYRNVRSLALSIREEDFVKAEVTLGASDFFIMFRHVFPLCFSVIIVIMTMGIANSIINAAGLGFLGLGVPPPIPELGADLAQGRQVIPRGIWWTTAGPSLFIFIMILGFNLFGEGLNKILGTRLMEL